MISRLDLLFMVMQIVFLLLLDSLILHFQQLNLLHHFFVLLFDILDGFRHCKVLNSVFIILILLLFFGSDQSGKFLDLLFHFDGSCVVLFLLTVVLQTGISHFLVLHASIGYHICKLVNFTLILIIFV